MQRCLVFGSDAALLPGGPVLDSRPGLASPALPLAAGFLLTLWKDEDPRLARCLPGQAEPALFDRAAGRPHRPSRLVLCLAGWPDQRLTKAIRHGRGALITTLASLMLFTHGLAGAAGVVATPFTVSAIGLVLSSSLFHLLSHPEGADQRGA
jgi:hypothetical protein